MFAEVFSQVLILMILVALGALLSKTGILTESGVRSITDMVLMTVTPCVIIKSFVREFDAKALKGLLISFLIAVMVHIGFIVLSRIILHSKAISRERVLRLGVVFTNCGYMSLPLQEAILGETGVFYGSSFIAIFNLFVWSYGIITISGDKKYLTPKKLVFNPGMIGLAVGLVIFLFSLPVPKIIYQPISFIAALNTPLPMIIIGYHLSKTDILKSIKDLQCLLASLVRMLLLPAVAIALMYLCRVRGDMLVSAAISCSAPTAAITTMFASKFGGDTELSVNMVSLTTIMSLLTMPLIITAAQMIA